MPVCIQKIPVCHKNLQAQIKKWKYKVPVLSHLQVKHNLCPPMFMPYIEEPKMDWNVNDGLYHSFLKWKLKCGENVLDCELATFPESKKVQESHSMDWKFWNGSICFLVLAHRRSLLVYYMGQV